MPQYPVPTTHSIIVGGMPLYLEFEAASTILVGDLVQFNSPAAGDCTIKAGVNNSEEIVGVAAISPQSATTPVRGGGRTDAEAYIVGDQVKVVRGPLTIMLRVATSEEIQCGEFVQPAASGEVKAYVCGTDNDCQRIAQSLQTLTQDTTASQWGMFALERFG